MTQSAYLAPSPVFQFLNASGAPLSGGLVFTYLNNTTTKATTYIDGVSGTPNTNPIVLDTYGTANIWLPPGQLFTFVISPSTDTDPPTNPIKTINNISAGGNVATVNFGVDVGSVNAPAATITGISTLFQGLAITLDMAFTNNDPVTLNVNGTGPKPVVLQNGQALSGGELQATGQYLFQYTGSVWQIMGLSVNGSNFLTSAEQAASVMPASFDYSPWRGNDFRRYIPLGGVTDYGPVLTTANSVGASIYVPPRASKWQVNSNTTLTVPLFFDSAGPLQPASGVSISINAAVCAGAYQIFDCSLGGTITGFIKAPNICPEWFGAKGDTKSGDAGNVNGIAFSDTNANFLSIDVGKTIVIRPPPFTNFPPCITTIAAVVSSTSITLTSGPSWVSQCSFTAGISTGSPYGSMVVSAVSSGALCPTMTINGAASGTTVNYQSGSYTGGVGTYYVSPSQSVASGTSMTASVPLTYYYGTDDTAAINAANTFVGQMSLAQGPTSNYNNIGQINKLTFSGSSIYLMTQSATIAGANNASADQWVGAGGTSKIVFAIAGSSTDCINFGNSASSDGASIEDMAFDASFTGRDLLSMSGFQSPRLRNVSLFNSGRNLWTIAPALPCWIQQGSFHNVYLESAGLHSLYCAPGAGSFVNECDFVNITMGAPAQRSALGAAFYFGPFSGTTGSWTIINYKATAYWNGDPNYVPGGSFVYFANSCFNGIGIQFINGYCEGGTPQNPIGSSVPPFQVAPGAAVDLRVQGFYANYWGLQVDRADFNSATTLTIAPSATVALCSCAQFYSASIEFYLTISDAAGANGAYLKADALGWEAAASPVFSTTVGPVVKGIFPSSNYTLGATISGNTLYFNFTNNTAGNLIVSYKASTRSSGAVLTYTS